MSEDLVEDRENINKSFPKTIRKKHNSLAWVQSRGRHILVVFNIKGIKESFKKDFEIEMIATIAHEAVHCCNLIFMHKGIRLDRDNDEPQAYLTDWIVKEIYKTYLKIKH